MAFRTALDLYTDHRRTSRYKVNRRLLFLAYYFSPHHAVASVRSTAIASNLAHMGWDVTVLTIDDSLLLEHDDTLPTNASGNGSLELVRTGHNLRFLFPSALRTNNRGAQRLVAGTIRTMGRRLGIEREIGWRRPAQRALNRLDPGGFDMVLSSGGPWLSHSLAASFARKNRCPYVLDYRDLWCGNPQARQLASSNERRRERQIRDHAAAITAVAPSIITVQDKLLGPHPNTFVVTNGYEETAGPNLSVPKQTAFVAYYGGQFYPPKSTINPFIKALRLLHDRNPRQELLLQYMGPSAHHVRRAVTEEGRKEGGGLLKMDIQGRMPRSKAVKTLQQADVALINALNGECATTAEASIITGKFFEVIGHRKPYLIIAPRNSDLHGIVGAAGGGRVFTSAEIEPMCAYLEEVMSGSPPCYKEPELFSWGTLSRRMDEILVAACRR